MGAETGGASIVVSKKTSPCLRQAEQSQGMARRRGVKDDVVESRSPASNQARKLIKRSDLCGASAGELLTHRGALHFGNVRCKLREHARAIGLGSGLRVGVHGREAWYVRDRTWGIGERLTEHLIQVGRR